MTDGGRWTDGRWTDGGRVFWGTKMFFNFFEKFKGTTFGVADHKKMGPDLTSRAKREI